MGLRTLSTGSERAQVEIAQIGVLTRLLWHMRVVAEPATAIRYFASTFQNRSLYFSSFGAGQWVSGLAESNRG